MRIGPTQRERNALHLLKATAARLARRDTPIPPAPANRNVELKAVDL